MTIEYICVIAHGFLIANKYFTIDDKTTLIQPACCGNISYSRSNDHIYLLPEIYKKLYKSDDSINKIDTIVHTNEMTHSINTKHYYNRSYLINRNTTLCDIGLIFINPLERDSPMTTFIGTFSEYHRAMKYYRPYLLPYIHTNNNFAFKKFNDFIHNVYNLLPFDINNEKYNLLPYKIVDDRSGYDTYYQITANLFGKFIENLLYDLFCKVVDESLTTDDLSYIEIGTSYVKFNNDIFPFHRLLSEKKIKFLPVYRKSDINIYELYLFGLTTLFNDVDLLSLVIQHAGLPENNNGEYSIKYPIIMNNNIINISTDLNTISITNDNLYMNDIHSSYLNSFCDFDQINRSDIEVTKRCILLINQSFYKLSYAYLWYCTFSRLSMNEYLIWNILTNTYNNSEYYLLSDVIRVINLVYNDTENVIYSDSCQSVEPTDDHEELCAIRSCVVKAAGLHGVITETRITKEELMTEIKALHISSNYNNLFIEKINRGEDKVLSDDDILLLNFINNYYNWTKDNSPIIARLKLCVDNMISLISKFPNSYKDSSCLVVNAKFILDEIKLAREKELIEKLKYLKKREKLFDYANGYSKHLDGDSPPDSDPSSSSD